MIFALGKLSLGRLPATQGNSKTSNASLLTWLPKAPCALPGRCAGVESQLASARIPPFLPQTGAVVIKDASGQIIGAAGASGGTGDEDEAICIAGVDAAGLAHGSKLTLVLTQWKFCCCWPIFNAIQGPISCGIVIVCY